MAGRVVGPWLVFVAVLFVGMLLMLEAGRRLRLRQAGAATAGLGAVEGAVLGLMGLLIAFTFSGAAERFDRRRHLIVEEANAISTAYLRLDVLPAAPRAALQQGFREYLDLRLALYSAGRGEPQRAGLERVAAQQRVVWAGAIAASAEAPETPVSRLLLPALNEMFDSANTRMAATLIHPPPVISALLVVLALVCSLLAGYAMAEGGPRSWTHILGFAASLTFTIYVIIDLEYPRLGLIRVDSFDQVLRDVRNDMR